MEGMINRSSSSPLQDVHSHSHSQIQSYDAPPAAATHDDFLEQMLSTIPNCSSWPDLSNNPNNNNNNNKSPTSDDQQTLPPNSGNPDAVHFPFDDSVLASKLRQHQMNENSSAAAVKSFLLQEQLMMSRGGGLRSPSGGDGTAAGGGDGGEAGGLLPHLNPLSLGGVGSGDSVDSRILLARSHGEVAAVQGGHGSVQALFNGFGGGGSLLGNNGQNPNQQPQFHHSPQNFGSPGGAAAAAAMNQTPGSASSGGGSGQAPQRQRVRARRGQATDPHSIAERLRRERIAERMKALQELVPNANKTDKASMLDEIIDYVKFLQLQVKVLSMSRLGGAAAVNPVVADMSAEGGGVSRTANGNQTAPSTNNNDSTLTVTEHQVAKLMKEDMGSAMQYLQGKGLCLMPISLATAISTATCHPRNSSSLSSSSAAAAAVAAAAAISGGVGNPLSNGIMNGASASNFNHQNGSNNALIVAASNGEGTPTSPNLSVLTVQSGGVAIAADGSVKDATSQ